MLKVFKKYLQLIFCERFNYFFNKFGNKYYCNCFNF